MVMLQAKPSVPSLSTVTCIICRVPAPPDNVTAGSLHSDGSQAFACTVHLRERRTWFIAWSTFEAEQRRARKAGEHGGGCAR